MQYMLWTVVCVYPSHNSIKMASWITMQTMLQGGLWTLTFSDAKCLDDIPNGWIPKWSDKMCRKNLWLLTNILPSLKEHLYFGSSSQFLEEGEMEYSNLLQGWPQIHNKF